MSDISFALSGWDKWLKGSSFVATKIGNADERNIRDYFSRVHAATEALLRQILFIGLRLNRVTYADANNWLYHNDITPNRQKYPAQVNLLFKVKGKTWDEIIQSQDDLGELWSLWNDYAKVIRNHVSHGVRSHDEHTLMTVTIINQALMMSLDKAFVPVVGGCISGGLAAFNPRLPRGEKGFDIAKLTGLNKSEKRAIPVKDVIQRMKGISLFTVIEGQPLKQAENVQQVNGGATNG